MKFVSIPYNDFIYEIFIYEMLCEIFVREGPPLLSANNLPAVQHSCYSKYLDLRPRKDYNCHFGRPPSCLIKYAYATFFEEYRRTS